MGAAADHHQLQSPGPSGAAWVQHGRLLTACLVALNAFLVLLVYVYFWRFFSRRDEEDAASSSEETSPPLSPKVRDRREVDRAITALPVFVQSSADSSRGGGAMAAAAECAICNAEFADGEEGRLLPRCGHRFHARCVDTWFRFHSTCPLCRDTVLHIAGDDPTDTVTVTTTNRSSDTDADCPV